MWLDWNEPPNNVPPGAGIKLNNVTIVKTISETVIIVRFWPLGTNKSANNTPMAATVSSNSCLSNIIECKFIALCFVYCN